MWLEVLDTWIEGTRAFAVVFTASLQCVESVATRLAKLALRDLLPTRAVTVLTAGARPTFVAACLQIWHACHVEQWGAPTAFCTSLATATLVAIGANVHLAQGCRVLSAACTGVLVGDFASPVVSCLTAVVAWRHPSFPWHDDVLKKKN